MKERGGRRTEWLGGFARGLRTVGAQCSCAASGDPCKMTRSHGQSLRGILSVPCGMRLRQQQHARLTIALSFLSTDRTMTLHQNHSDIAEDHSCTPHRTRLKNHSNDAQNNQPAPPAQVDRLHLSNRPRANRATCPKKDWTTWVLCLPSLHRRVSQDVQSLIRYIHANAFEPMPDRAAGMGSERISEVLRFRAEIATDREHCALACLERQPDGDGEGARGLDREGHREEGRDTRTRQRRCSGRVRVLCWLKIGRRE